MKEMRKHMKDGKVDMMGILTDRMKKGIAEKNHRFTRMVALVSILVAVCLFSGFMHLITWANRPNNGIVVLPGFEHGVALCEDTFSAVIHEKEATLWADGIAFYTVNKGHYDDPEVQRLVKLAHVECPAQATPGYYDKK